MKKRSFPQGGDLPRTEPFSLKGKDSVRMKDRRGKELMGGRKKKTNAGLGKSFTRRAIHKNRSPQKHCHRKIRESNRKRKKKSRRSEKKGDPEISSTEIGRKRKG